MRSTTRRAGIPQHSRTSPKLPKSAQDAAVERVVHTDELTARDRAAAILVIVFGQHIEDVIQLTWDDVTVTDDVGIVRLGKTEFALPSPLDEPMRQLAAAPGNDLTASHPNSNWVFRGYSPGSQHPRREPPKQTQGHLQHPCCPAWITARADQARAGADHRRRAGLPPVDNRAPRHWFGEHLR
ncbi:hypothetical protein AB0L70_05305 [Kribbella sp. NPDC051952]|uniref:hypothetical protein n=1 Tax=Kribbella sp. NPDC051952 TaxID=3154851 RepID=UPI0034448709